MSLASQPGIRLRRLLLISIALLVARGSYADKEPFTEARFASLQAEGALILVDIHADWCPTCARQQKVLDAYEASRPDLSLHRLVVDFDDDKQWVKHFAAPRQSTLILFRGTEKRWFSVAETNEERIFAALDAAAGHTP